MSRGELILGIESSCDETASAVVNAHGGILSNVISSQVAIHHEYGGVVPELASRHHILNIVPVVDRALAEAGCTLNDLAGIAVTAGPGLVGALLVGLQFAKSLACVSGVPLVAVDHLTAHLEAVYLHEPGAVAHQPDFPHACLLVSGGHTLLGARRSPQELEILGATRDDAAGEAFDKVAKMMGLGYPGGQIIDLLAAKGDPTAVRFPRAMLDRKGWDFSFSGLKTAVKLYLARSGKPTGEQSVADLCASFQEAVVDVLVIRARAAVTKLGLRQLVVAGGVAANSHLRRRLDAAAREDGFELFVPEPLFCTDNGAMVAFAGHRLLARGEVAGMDLNARSAWAGKTR